MMKMQMQFFEGELTTVQDKFNEWSNGEQYVAETSLHFKGKDRSYAVLKVLYGKKEQESSARRKRFM